MKRLLALVAAAAMIAGALYVRGDSGGPVGGVLAGGEPLHLLCVSELRAACDQLAGDGVEVTVREAGQTAAELSLDEPPAADGWLTVEPWPAIVEEARARAAMPSLLGDPILVGRSPLVMVGREDRLAALEAACRGPFSWRCVGNQAGKRWAEIGGDAAWGTVRPGMTDPETSASGLLVLGHAVSEFFGGADFTARDLEDPRFAGWLGDLKRSVPSFGIPTATPLQQMVQRRGAYDLVGTIEAESGPTLARAAADRTRGLTVVGPDPGAVAEAVLAPLGSEADDRLGELVEERGHEVLAKNGWRVEGQPSAPGVEAGTPLPADTNLPNAGVLEALRRRWAGITR